MLQRYRQDAHLSWNDFSQSGGTGAAQCTERFYPPSARVVALSTDLFNKKHNCLKVVTIYYKRKKSTAMVVDQCAFEDGCPPNTIDASTQVWHDLGIYERNPIFGGMSVTWTMAS
ncbi:hypothetical protein K2173_022684 [Erythroxylum novogranatense]|uniref:Uncharacterized protein n=1 Tax=Erythroxylum novogranatense TaxID=1862640 RepID=A0AAV8TNW8_9ROSI|nr:hypothetical protein K2173_022684 [Erythroxylum novogranatense]